MTDELKRRITTLADRYETADFLKADPSRFMHCVEGEENQEAMAFLASCLSYGARSQFFPKIQHLLDFSQGNVHNWVMSGAWRACIPDTSDCFYRLYSCHDMCCLLAAYEAMLGEYGSMKEFVRRNATTGIEAVEALCRYFAIHGASRVVPKNAASACKRVCMFLRWIVRRNSPVDLGLWQDIIDRRSLIMPLDTHVLQEAAAMGLLSSRTASMRTARRLTDAMLEVFPDDPLRGDFALFGLGVDR